jgi:hypothetical protein
LFLNAVAGLPTSNPVTVGGFDYRPKRLWNVMHGLVPVIHVDGRANSEHNRMGRRRFSPLGIAVQPVSEFHLNPAASRNVIDKSLFYRCYLAVIVCRF